MDCPSCHLVNPDSAERCDCGYDFRSRTLKSSYLWGDQLGHLAGELGQGNLRAAELLSAVESGYRFVVFNYCISLLVVTFKRTSRVHLVRPGANVMKLAAPYTCITLLLGWWGIPWGPIYSIQSLVVNARGGHDITQLVLASHSSGAT